MYQMHEMYARVFKRIAEVDIDVCAKAILPELQTLPNTPPQRQPVRRVARSIKLVTNLGHPSVNVLNEQ